MKTKRTASTPKPQVRETWISNFNYKKVIVTEVTDEKVYYTYLDGQKAGLGVGVFTHYFKKVD